MTAADIEKIICDLSHKCPDGFQTEITVNRQRAYLRRFRSDTTFSASLEADEWPFHGSAGAVAEWLESKTKPRRPGRVRGRTS